MTKIKLCGLTKPVDIETANRLKPDYVGFVFAEKSKRYVIPEQALYLKKLLSPEIKAVGVFVNAGVSFVEDLLLLLVPILVLHLLLRIEVGKKYHHLFVQIEMKEDLHHR